MFEINKTYTLEDFTTSDFKEKTVTAWGGRARDLTWDGKAWEINTSSILTRLIQAAGRYCESYASDLFIDWKILEENLENPDYTGGRLLFGFRESGVDGNSFILSRYNNDGKYARYEYRAMYALDVKIEPDGCMTMELGRVF